MTFDQLMKVKGVSLTAALVEYWIGQIDVFLDWHKHYLGSTFDGTEDAARCLANALEFVG